MDEVKEKLQYIRAQIRRIGVYACLFVVAAILIAWSFAACNTDRYCSGIIRLRVYSVVLCLEALVGVYMVYTFYKLRKIYVGLEAAITEFEQRDHEVGAFNYREKILALDDLYIKANQEFERHVNMNDFEKWRR